MSWRRNLSFANHEKHLVEAYDDRGKSDFAKLSMNFFLKYENLIDRMVIVPDTFNPFQQSTNEKQSFQNTKPINESIRQKVSKVFK
jgi:hypothetical protein